MQANLPTWAKKTLSFAGENIGNPIDPRRIRSEFQRAGIVLSFHDDLLSKTCYLMIGSDLKSYNMLGNIGDGKLPWTKSLILFRKMLLGS